MKKKSKKSTALVRRKATTPARRILPTSTPATLVPTERHVLSEEASTEGLGLMELKLTPQEEEVLARPVNVDHVLVKPTGQVYLSHPTYIAWFNQAFGRLGWRLVPNAKPLKSDTGVLCPYILFIHGVPVAFVYGEQDYHDNNKEQTYGDAIEATRASALRRCAKQLGVGLELWDKTWTREFERQHVVKVFLKDKDRPAFRLRSDPPFWNEVGEAGKRRPDESRGKPATETPVASHAHEKDPITEGQLKRFWAIARKAGRTDPELAIWLTESGLKSSKDITRGDYENYVHAVEHPGPLQPVRPVGREGQ